MATIGLFYGNEAYPPTTGGTVHRYQLTKGLTERGHRVLCWYLTEGVDPNCTHLRGRELFRFLREINVLYVRIEWQSVFALWLTAGLARLAGVPLIWELNSVPDEILFSGADRAELARVDQRLRFLARFVSACVCVSQGVADYARRDLGIKDAPSIPNGSSPAMFRPSTATVPAQRALEVVWAGTSQAGWHDLPALFEAARLLDERGANIRFRIFGDKAGLPSDLPENVHACGLIKYEDFGDAISSSDVGVHLFKPGFDVDGSPLKLFDYMSCGLALVAQDRGQRGEIMRQGAGLTTTGSPEDLAAVLERLEADRDSCAEFGRTARRLVETYYNWDRVAEEVGDVVDRCATKRR